MNANPRKTWAGVIDLVLSWPPIENTPSATITRQDDNAARGAEAKALRLQRGNDNTPLEKRQGEVRL